MDQDTAEATKEAAKAIHPINSTTVHKICSGQVVLNLATAVKELVENALDAGATIIEVKLRDMGQEMIEVSDNGEGVEESNFEGLTAKYHTSKIREFADLEGVETFGFRGEALSSLCALSKMVITTRYRTAEYGTRLELDERGAIVKKDICARQPGTTVQLTNLFDSLPVRKKEFARNIKREFAKMGQILQGYCLVATKVRIICTNQNQKGIRAMIMSTNGGSSVMDNISTVFGAKQVFDLLRIVSPADLDVEQIKAVLEEVEPNSSSDVIDNLSDADLKRFSIDGWISTCQHGAGRSSKDRQFIYINSRPCEPKKVAKIINEMYNRFNQNQNPFVFLNIIVKRSEVDVNITPDKRQLLLHNENVLFLVLKACLYKTFSSVPSTYKLQNLNLSSKQPESTSREDSFIETAPNPTKFSQMLAQWKKTGQTCNPSSSEKVTKRKVVDEVQGSNMKMRKIQDYLRLDETVPVSDDETLSSSIDQSMIDKSVVVDESIIDKSAIDESIVDESIVDKSRTANGMDSLSLSSYLKPLENSSTPERQNEFKAEKKSPLKIIDSYKGVTGPSKAKSQAILDRILKSERDPDPSTSEPIDRLAKTDSDSDGHNSEIESDDDAVDSTSDPVTHETYDESDDNSFIDADEEQISFKSQCIRDVTDAVTTSIDKIAELMAAERNFDEQTTKHKLDRLKFKATIEPGKNQLAEKELQTEISKQSFSHMEIIGQFNLGFIVVKLDDDLFIVDQHATDEKFNYETLQKEKILINQKLFMPQPLELTAVSEMVLIDNLEVFEKNGFQFQIDEDAPTTKKVKLTAKPMSKSWEFGKEEIDELIFLLQESPNTVLRPSKVSAMFASKACRKSVMIGTALSRSDMQRLITQMGQIEHPWNCPHGRPTMRHLVNLSMLNASDED